MKLFYILAYLSAIVFSNTLTASLEPLHFGSLIIPFGTFLIAFSFVFRDAVQHHIGRRNTYLTILSAMVLSAVTSWILGDTLWIVFASAITFLFSETADTEVYTRLKFPQSLRVLYSGTVGGILDSVIFVVIGLSPLGAGFIPWQFVITAILGQIVVKISMQVISAIVVHLATRGALSNENPNT